jgi:hypothetical protein
MSLADTIKNITGPLVRNLADQLGSTVTFRRPVVTRGPDNSSRRTWTDFAVGTKVIIESLNQFKAQQLWGMQTTVAAQALLPMTNFDLTDTPQSRQGMVVTAGFLLGHKYTISETKPDDLGQNLVLALIAPEDNDI